jgi:hypothetical protein
MVTIVLNLIIRKVKPVVNSETSMRTFIELNWALPGGERELANEKIRSRRRPIAAGYRGGEIKECKITLENI